MNFLTTAEIIKQAKARGFDFGKGDPTNRLRYYIKLGMLPHMERRQAKPTDRFTQGFMPENTVELLLNIQNLKKGIEPVTYKEPTIVPFPKIEKANPVVKVIKPFPYWKLALATVPVILLAAVAFKGVTLPQQGDTLSKDSFQGVLAASTIPGNLEINVDTTINGKLLVNDLEIENKTLIFADTVATLTNKTIDASKNTLKNIANSSLTNSKVTVSSGTNLTGGGDVSLGSSVSLALKNDITLNSASLSALFVTGVSTFSGNLIPLGDKIQDLGSTTNYWGTAYINELYVNGFHGSLGFWQQNAGTIAPVDITDDVLVGGTATATAKLRISGLTGSITTGIWNGTTVAVGYGGTGVTSLSDILGTANQITVGNGTGRVIGGNVTLSLPDSLQLVNATISGTLGVGGHLTVTSNILPSYNGTQDLGSPSNHWGTAYIDNISGSTWSGDPIGAQYGGTGQSAVAVGDLLYGSAVNTWSRLTAGTQNQLLITQGNANPPAWANLYSLLTPGTDITLGGSTIVTINNASTLQTVTGRGAATTNPVTFAGTTFTTQSVSDLPTGGNIGTAGNTVDLYSSFGLNQTTSGQTITLPTPTSSTAGKLVYLSNKGSVSFTFLGTSVLAGTTTAAIWNGTAWTLAGGGGTADSWQRNLGVLSPSNITDDLVLGSTATAGATFKVGSTGIVSAGTWQGSVVGTTYGGTGVASLSDVLGTGGQLNVSNGTGRVIGGNVTLSLSPDLALLGGISAKTFNGMTIATGSGTLAPTASPTFTGTVTIPTPFTLGATSVTTTGTQLNYLNAATGTTGTTSTNLVFSTSPTLVTPTLGAATATSINKVAITAPATGSTLTIADGQTLTVTTGGTLGSAAYTASTAYQSANSNLTSLAGLSYASTSFVKMTGANTFTLDTTNYMTSITGTADQINISGSTISLAPDTKFIGDVTAKTFNGITLATGSATLDVGTGGTLGSAAFTASTAYQAVNSNLTSLAGLSYSSDSFVKMTGANTFSLDATTNYLLLAGRSGGQTAIGGTAVTDMLKLQGTSGNGTATSPAIQSLVGNNGATVAMTILNNGNVGIGTTGPSAKLDVSGGAIRLDNNQWFMSKQTGGDNLGLIMADTNNDTRLLTGGGTNLVIYNGTQSTELVRITNAGNVGIGTTAPLAKLDVNGTASVAGTLTLNAANSLITTTNNRNLQLINANNYFTATTGFINNQQICTADGNCSGLGGVVGGTGTQNYVTKWNNAGGTNIGNSNITDDGSLITLGSNSSVSGSLTINAANSLITTTNNRNLQLVNANNYFTATTGFIDNYQICTAAGNCSGTGAGIGGSGTQYYVARFSGTYNIENGTLWDNGKVGVGTTAPTTLFSVGTNSDATINGTGDIVARTFNGITLATGSATLDVGTGGTLGSAAYTASTAYQSANSNLTSLAGLSYASTSFVKMTGANTFALDTTSYLSTLTGTANQINISGSTISLAPDVKIWGDMNAATFNGVTIATGSGTLTMGSASLNIGTGGTLGSAAYTASTAYQAVNSNLTSLAGLSYASTSFVKMTGANTFALDTTTYLSTLTGTANQINISGSTISLAPDVKIWGDMNAATFNGMTIATGSGTLAPTASPTFTGTVTIPTPFTLGATSVTTTGTQLNYLNAATGTTGTTSTNLVFSTSPTLVTPTLGAATATSINKVTITAPATGSTLTIADGQTLTVTTGGTLGSAAYTASTAYQSANSNLTSLAGLSYASTSFVKMTGANTFTLDTTTYLSSITGTADQINVNGSTLSLAPDTKFIGDVTAKTFNGNIIATGSGTLATLAGSEILTNKTMSTGSVWNGTAIGTQYGGTGQNWSATAQGSLPYFNGSGTMAALGVGTLSQVLTTGGAGANPAWTNMASLISGTAYQITVSGTQTLTLSVPSDFRAPGTINAVSGLYTGATAGTQRVDASGNLVNIGNITASGNVGIGTTSPSGKLHVNGSCVTGDTLLRRRRKKKKGQNDNDEDEWEDVPVADIKPDDEILTLDEKTEKFTVSKVRQLMNMGVKKTILLTTNSGKSIRTTQNHPYLVRPATTPSILGGILQADQSPRLEDLNRDSFIALANENIHFILKINKEFKKELYREYQKTNRTKFFAPDIFGRSIAAILYYSQAAPSGLLIDAEYPGYEKRIEETIRLVNKKLSVSYKSLGHSCQSFAHWAAYRAFKKEYKATLEVVCETTKKDRGAQRVGQGAVTLIPLNQIRNTRDLFTKVYQNSLDLSRAKWQKVREIKPGMEIVTKDGWEKIVVIKELGDEYVYDLEIENTHNFVANGIVAHNTTGKALVIFDETGDQNILTASASGVTKFTLDRSGNIGSATWNGTAVGATYGGTGQTTVTTGDLLYGSAANTWGKLADVATGNVLLSGGIATAPSWGQVVLGTHTTGNYASQIIGTANQITASAATGDVTLSIPSDFRAPGTINAVSGLYTGATAGTQRVDASGNLVNIGTASMSGALTLTGTPTIASTAMQTLNLGGTTTGNIQLSAGSATPAFILTTAGNLGIGTTGPGYRLSVYGDATSGDIEINRGTRADNANLVLDGNGSNTYGGKVYFRNTGTANGFIQYSNNLSFVSAGGTQGLYQQNDGNVGIGTTNPTNALDVNGGFRVLGATGGTAVGAGAEISYTGGTAYYQAYNRAGSAWLPTAVDGLTVKLRNSGVDAVTVTGGNVGIGTTAPGEKLEVAGNIKLGSANYIIAPGTDGGIRSAADTDELLIGDSAKQGYLIMPGTNFGATEDGSFLFTSRYIAAQSSNANIKFRTYNGTTVSELMVLDRLGNVGIGGLTAATTPGLYVQTSGNVGIGTTSPGHLLSLKATSAVDGIEINAQQPTLYFTDANGGQQSGQLWFDDGKFGFMNSDEKMRLGTNGGLSLGNSYVTTDPGAGSMIISGNVGIGTTSPLAKLDVNGTASVSGALSLYGTPTIASTALQTLTLGGTTTGNIQLSPGSATPSLTVTTAGNIGIGTTGPGAKLHSLATTEQLRLGYDASNYVGFTVNSAGDLTVDQTGPNGLTINDLLRVATINDNGGNLTLNTQASGRDLRLQANSQTGITVKGDSGNVGIGTTGPQQKLDVAGSIKINAPSDSVSGGGLFLYNATTAYAGVRLTSTGNHIAFDTYSGSWGEKVRIENGGNVGIGTTGPGQALAINRSSGSSSINFDNAGATKATVGLEITGGQIVLGSSANDLAIRTIGGGILFSDNVGGTEVMRIKSGNVGIGTTAPNDLLEVNKSQNAQTGVRVANANAGTAAYSIFQASNGTYNSYMGIFGTGFTTGGANIQNGFTIQTDSPAGIQISANVNNAPIQFFTHNGTSLAERVRISNSGNVGIGTTSPQGKLHVNGNCVTGDTLLPIRRRKKKGDDPGAAEDSDWEFMLCFIKDIMPGDEVLSLDEATGGLKYARINKLRDMGIHEVFEITTKSGKKIKTTDNHPYLTLVENI